MYARGVREDDNQGLEHKEENEEEKEENGSEKIVEPNPFYDEKFLDMNEVSNNLFDFLKLKSL